MKKRKETVCGKIKTSWHSISKMYNALGAEQGLSTTQGFVLINIDQEHGTPVTKIGPMLGLEPRSLSRMLKSMEEHKLIERKADDTDKRLVRVLLTPEGKRKQSMSKATIKEFNQTVAEVVGQERLQIFLQVIDQINQIADNHKQIFNESIQQ